MAAIPPALAVPCLINLVEGGRTPLLGLAAIEEMGYAIALYANLAMRVAARSVSDAFAVLRRDGSSAALVDRMLSWEERQELVDLDGWQALDRGIADGARAILEGRLILASDQEGRDAHDHDSTR